MIMKTKTIIFLALFLPIGLMAQNSSKPKKELKIHANAREKNPLLLDNYHKHMESKTENLRDKQLKFEKRTRPHFYKKTAKERQEKSHKSRPERKERLMERNHHEKRGK